MTIGYERQSLPLKAAGFLLAPVLFVLLWCLGLFTANAITPTLELDGVGFLGLAVAVFGVIADIAGALIASTFAKLRARRRVK